MDLTPPGVLTLAIDQALDRGLRVPCVGRDEWTSDSREDRAHAASACLACPVLAECAAAAAESVERLHVWGGVDRGAGSTASRSKECAS